MVDNLTEVDMRLPPTAFLVLATACAPARATLSEQERAAVASSVDSATRAFEAAQRQLSAESAIAALAPDFFMRVDGVRMPYDTVVAGIRRSMPGLAHLEPGFSDITIGVLSPDAAFASLVFRDSAVMKSGEVRRSTGPTTLVFQRRAGRWLIVYADADHRSLPEP